MDILHQLAFAWSAEQPAASFYSNVSQLALSSYRVCVSHNDGLQLNDSFFY